MRYPGLDQGLSGLEMRYLGLDQGLSGARDEISRIIPGSIRG